MSYDTEGQLGRPDVLVIPITAETATEPIVAANALRNSVTIKNVGTDPVYISPDIDVDDSTGWKIPAGGKFVDDFSIGEWYAVVAASETAALRILEVI